jgi:hypothetical protein
VVAITRRFGQPAWVRTVAAGANHTGPSRPQQSCLAGQPAAGAAWFGEGFGSDQAYWQGDMYTSILH